MSGPTCNYSFRESTFNVICQVRTSEKKKQMDEEREVAGHKKSGVWKEEKEENDRHQEIQKLNIKCQKAVLPPSFIANLPSSLRARAISYD